jgi:hypothetical protein
MTRKILIVLIGILMLSFAGSAFAQFSDDRPSKFGIRLVSFVPMSSDLKDAKSVWFGPSVDWHLKLDDDNRQKSYLSVTLLNPGDDSPYKPSNNSLTYTRIHRKPISQTRCHYLGYGAGIHKLEYHGMKQVSPVMAVPVNSSGYQLGIHGLYGQEFNDTYFAELRFSFLPKKDDVDWSGIYLSVGSRISL